MGTLASNGTFLLAILYFIFYSHAGKVCHTFFAETVKFKRLNQAQTSMVEFKFNFIVMCIKNKMKCLCSVALFALHKGRSHIPWQQQKTNITRTQYTVQHTVKHCSINVRFNGQTWKSLKTKLQRAAWAPNSLFQFYRKTKNTAKRLTRSEKYIWHFWLLAYLFLKVEKIIYESKIRPKQMKCETEWVPELCFDTLLAHSV